MTPPPVPEHAVQARAPSDVIAGLCNTYNLAGGELEAVRMSIDTVGPYASEPDSPSPRAATLPVSERGSTGAAVLGHGPRVGVCDTVGRSHRLWA